MTTVRRRPLAEVVGSWRIAMRLAWRTSRRRPLRSLLVVVMLAIPVLAATVLVQSWTSVSTDADQVATWRLGDADLLVHDNAQPDELAALLPAGSRQAPRVAGTTIVEVGGTHQVHHYRGAAVTDPMIRDAYAVRQGEAPTGPDEVALTSHLSDALDAPVGSTILAGMPQRELTVAGIVDTLDRLSRHALLVPPEHPLSAGGRRGAYVTVPESSAGWRPPMSLGATSRADAGPSAEEEAVAAAGFAVVVGFAVAQVALLVAAAFAVGARRQRRELALVAAAGADGRQLSRMVLANGVVLGAAGGLLGVVLGWATFQVGRGVLERQVDHPLAAGVPAWQLLGIAVLAIAVGVLAAWGPARAVDRRPVQESLAGREVAAGRGSRRLCTAGLLAAAGGIAAAVWATRPAVASPVLAAAGGGMILLGAAACAPALVPLSGRLMNRATVPVRLAGRHAARHQLRTGAAAAAVCAAMAGSVGVTLYFSADLSTGLATQPTAPTGQVLLAAPGASMLSQHDVARLAAELPARDVVQLRTLAAPAAYTPAGPMPDQAPPQRPTTVAVGGADVIRAATGRDPAPEAVAALRHGDAVAFYPELASGGQVSLAGAEPPVELPATLVAAPADYRDGTLPGVVLPGQTAARLGLAGRPGGVIVDTTRPPTPAELAAAHNVVLAAQVRDGADALAGPVSLSVGHEPAAGRQVGAVPVVLALVSALVTMAASAVAVGLATSEMRDDLSTLAAVGAGPQARRWVAAAQAGVVVGIGVLLGIAGGITPAAGLVGMHEELAWRMPWGAVVTTAVGAPAVAVAGTALFARQRAVLVRRPS